MSLKRRLTGAEIVRLHLLAEMPGMGVRGIMAELRIGHSMLVREAKRHGVVLPHRSGGAVKGRSQPPEQAAARLAAVRARLDKRIGDDLPAIRRRLERQGIRATAAAFGVSANALKARMDWIKGDSP